MTNSDQHPQNCSLFGLWNLDIASQPLICSSTRLSHQRFILERAEPKGACHGHGCHGWGIHIPNVEWCVHSFWNLIIDIIGFDHICGAMGLIYGGWSKWCLRPIMLRAFDSHRFIQIHWWDRNLWGSWGSFAGNSFSLKSSIYLVIV